MPEGTKKKHPSWLTGEPEPAQPAPRISPGRRGPLVEDDTGEQPTVTAPAAESAQQEGAPRTIPRVSVSPGTGERSPRTPLIREDDEGTFLSALAARLRENPKPTLIAFLVLLAIVSLFWFAFLRGEGGDPKAGAASSKGAPTDQQAAADPFGGGPVRDSGVKFGALRESGGTAELDGAGLEWQGTVTKKEGESGETLTLEGPTAAQLERGFDLGPAAIETGVYAVAQDDGEVLHITTHTFVPKEEGAGAQEMTLGTVYSLSGGTLDGYAYYLDRREPGSEKVTRTYVRPGESSYRVSYEAPIQQDQSGGSATDGHGTFVPLLVGWRGFEDDNATKQEGE